MPSGRTHRSRIPSNGYDLQERDPTSLCPVALTSMLDFFVQVIDTNESENNKVFDLVNLDLQNAFDKVLHEKLVAKVNEHGIQGDRAIWIRNWL